LRCPGMSRTENFPAIPYRYYSTTATGGCRSGGGLPACPQEYPNQMGFPLSKKNFTLEKSFWFVRVNIMRGTPPLFQFFYQRSRSRTMLHGASPDEAASARGSISIRFEYPDQIFSRAKKNYFLRRHAMNNRPNAIRQTGASNPGRKPE
jgi:hypothetical protein